MMMTSVTLEQTLPMVEVPDIFGVKDQWFLVTGGSSGIGLATAKLLAQFGANLVIIARNEAKLEQAKSELEAFGTQIQTLSFDIGDLEKLPELIEQFEPKVFKGIFLNAAMAADMTVTKFLTIENVEQMTRRNMHSPLLMISQLLRGRRIAKGGTIVFTSSIGSFLGTPGTVVYSANKAGLEGMSKVLSRELGAQGIRVNALAPGMVETAFSVDESTTMTQEYYEIDRKRYPLGYGHVDDTAKSALYLLSDQSSWMTAHTLILDGGRTCR
jgi:NAD(P)-dependent dehydrogenase (short-subunit alcohol dehydrogenase family)